MSKPLVEYVSPTVWKVLLVLLIIAILIATIIGAINASQNERIPEPWEYPPEERYS